jgi:hypothetical protein
MTISKEPVNAHFHVLTARLKYRYCPIFEVALLNCAWNAQVQCQRLITEIPAAQSAGICCSYSGPPG